MAPLHGILSDTAQPTSTSTVTSTVPHGVTIIIDIKRFIAMSRARPLPRLIRYDKTHHWHWHDARWFRFDLTQGF